MVSLLSICAKIQEQLNTNSNNAREYRIYSDGATHQEPTRNGNAINYVVEGIAQIMSSSIVPVQGLKIGTQSIYIEMAIPLDNKIAETEYGIETTVDLYKQDINALVSQPQIQTIDGYVTTMTGTLAEVKEIQQSSSLGLMIPISFTVELNYFLNGVNSLNEKLYYNNKEIHFTSMSIARVVTQDGGAFSNTNGIAKNYVQNTALSIELTIPALINKTNNIEEEDFYKLFRDFLFNGTSNNFTITYTNETTNTNKNYTMIFATSNSQSQGADNVGYTITLVEAL